MEKQIYRFNNDIETLEVSSAGAKIIIIPHDAEEFYAEYENPKDTPEFCAVLSGKTLTFKEKLSFSLFNFGAKPTEGYTITVKVPAVKLAKLKVNTASGGADISGVTAEEFDLNTASGSINVNACFDNVKVQSASGNIYLTNPEDKTVSSISVCTVSGSAEINNYKAEKFNLHSVSGRTSYNSATGAGKIAVTSGSVDVKFIDWNSDLDISAISGNINVSLPAGSGIDVKFDGVSGILRTDIGTTRGSYMNLGKGTSGQMGGENMHKVNISITSGTVTLSQGEEASAKTGIDLEKQGA